MLTTRQRRRESKGRYVKTKGIARKRIKKRKKEVIKEKIENNFSDRS